MTGDDVVSVVPAGIVDPKSISKTVEAFARAARSVRLDSRALPRLPIQVGTLEAFQRLAESARSMTSVLIKFRPPLPASVRDVPPVPVNSGDRGDFARARARRTAKLCERRRAIRRNRAYIRKFGPPPKIVTSLAQGRYRTEDGVLTFMPT